MAEGASPFRRSPRLAGRGIGAAAGIPPIPIALAHRRSHETIVANRKRGLPDGFPSGPFNDFEDARVNISKYISNPAAIGGAYSVTWAGEGQKANSRAGAKKQLKCDKHKKPKAAVGTKANKNTGCSWNLWLEESDVGVVIKYFDVQEHNP